MVLVGWLAAREGIFFFFSWALTYIHNLHREASIRSCFMHVPTLRVLPTNPYNTLLLWVFFVCGFSSMLLAVCAQVGQGDRVAGGAVASGPQAGLLQLFLRDTRLRRSGSVGGGHEPAQSECWGCRAACVRTRFFLLSDQGVDN